MTKLLLSACVLAVLASHAVAGPLHDAVKDGDIAQVGLLIAQGGDVNQRDLYLASPLHQTAIWGNGDIAELLIAEGADTNFQHPLLGTPLNLAALKGNEAVAAVLIASGADLGAGSASRTTPLHAAAEGGHATVVELLVANGADVNARRTRHDEPDDPDYAPIHSAGLNGHFDIVDLLRALGATGPTIKPVSNLLASADPVKGEKVFGGLGSGCRQCHIIEKDGPAANLHGYINLWGVLGRKKAGIEDFTYSAAFGRLLGTWTLAEFSAFIAAPMDYAPGTKMEFNGVKDAAERANLIAFLRQNSDDPPPLPASVASR